MQETKLNNLALIVSRALLATLFVSAGLGKIANYQGTAKFMDAGGVPSALLPLVIITELGGGLAILFGFLVQKVALGLAAFTILSGIVFHFVPGDRSQMVHFVKNLAIAGGFLALAAAGPGRWSIDKLLGSLRDRPNPTK